jgi:hypothetical protein
LRVFVAGWDIIPAHTGAAAVVLVVVVDVVHSRARIGVDTGVGKALDHMFAHSWGVILACRVFWILLGRSVGV